jgi:thiamine kinase-like enzyme
MFRLIEFYLTIVDQHSMRIPQNYRDSLSQVTRIEAALGRRPLPLVPCNNDLLAGNYIDDGQQLWLIDFEYSSNNDPCFELGNTCQERQFDDPRLAEVCAAYFRATDRDKLARMKLNMIMLLAWCVHAHTALGLVAAAAMAVLIVRGDASSHRRRHRLRRTRSQLQF